MKLKFGMFETATDFFSLLEHFAFLRSWYLFMFSVSSFKDISRKHGELKACEKAKVKNEIGGMLN